MEGLDLQLTLWVVRERTIRSNGAQGRGLRGCRNLPKLIPLDRDPWQPCKGFGWHRLNTDILACFMAFSRKQTNLTRHTRFPCRRKTTEAINLRRAPGILTVEEVTGDSILRRTEEGFRRSHQNKPGEIRTTPGRDRSNALKPQGFRVPHHHRDFCTRHVVQLLPWTEYRTDVQHKPQETVWLHTS
jgi:hypothetical protein